jgi:SAM-dependent methyltransferase
MSDAPDSASWYDRHIGTYAHATDHLDLSDLYARFLAHVPAGGRVLDAGCGTGRDAAAFERAGYRVTATDASPAMVEAARARIRGDVFQIRHEEVDIEQAFDGIWSNASLLHVATADLPHVLGRYARALVPAGVLFASFKHGQGEVTRRGRRFTNHTEASFRTLLAGVPELDLVEVWVEADRRPTHAGEHWLNTLSRRCP